MIQGIIITMVFNIFLVGVGYIGYRLGKKKPDRKVVEVDEATKERANQLKKDFESMMAYDTNTALQRK